MRNETHDPKEVCEQRLAQFIERFGVRKCRFSYRSLLNLFRQGGSSRGDVEKHLVDHWVAYLDDEFSCHEVGIAEPFDHLEMWGRHRTPLFLVGHPYEISKEAFETLDAIRRLGMTVVVDVNTWYGHGTMHICVYHRNTVAARAVPSVWWINQNRASRLVGPRVSTSRNGDGIGHS